MNAKECYVIFDYSEKPKVLSVCKDLETALEVYKKILNNYVSKCVSKSKYDISKQSKKIKIERKKNNLKGDKK